MKPAGILTSGNGFKTIARALDQNLKASSLADACEPQPCHRLDYATTGILLVGKTHAAIRRLNQLFQQKKIHKSYRAITLGPMKSFGQVTLEIDSKPALSMYTVLRRVPSERFEVLNLVEIQPKTGRRHQIRKHMASLGNPILGDKDYGKEGLILQGKGMYLHAHSLSFAHPFRQEALTLKAPLPKKFAKIFPEEP